MGDIDSMITETKKTLGAIIQKVCVLRLDLAKHVSKIVRFWAHCTTRVRAWVEGIDKERAR